MGTPRWRWFRSGLGKNEAGRALVLPLWPSFLPLTPVVSGRAAPSTALVNLAWGAVIHGVVGDGVLPILRFVLFWFAGQRRSALGLTA